MTGQLNMNNFNVNNVLEGLTNLQAVNRQQLNYIADNIGTLNV